MCHLKRNSSNLSGVQVTESSKKRCLTFQVKKSDELVTLVTPPCSKVSVSSKLRTHH